MEREPEAQPTVFQKFGGSLYLKIPKDRYQHLEISDMLKENTSNKKPAKFQAEKNSDGEKYVTGWNPNAASQNQDEEDNQ